MTEFALILYSRKNCCLCEGLEQKLRSIPLHDLRPSLFLHVIDIDRSELPERLRTRYDLEVPVMALSSSDLKPFIELPRASPRLDGEGLFQWLQKKGIPTALGID